MTKSIGAMRSIDYEVADAEFTPDTLETCAKQVDDLRHDYLFGIDGAGADTAAEQLYLIALGHLESAHRYFKLAKIAQSRALAER